MTFGGRFEGMTIGGSGAFQLLSLPGTTVRSVPLDSQGFSFIGKGTISAGTILSRGQGFDATSGTDRVKIVTLGTGMVTAGQQGFFPAGAIGLVTKTCDSCRPLNNYDVPVLLGVKFTSYYSISSNTSRIFIMPRTNTPPNTFYMIFGKRRGE
jgi:hypothetical protein